MHFFNKQAIASNFMSNLQQAINLVSISLLSMSETAL